MKVTSMLAAIAATTAALPTSLDQGLSEVELRAALEARSDIEARQVVGTTANELTQGSCRPLILIFARGSTEPGNLVRIMPDRGLIMDMLTDTGCYRRSSHLPRP